MKKLIVESLTYKGTLIGGNDIKFNNIVILQDDVVMDNLARMYGKASRLFFNSIFMNYDSKEELLSNLKFKEDNKSTTRKFLNRVMS